MKSILMIEADYRDGYTKCQGRNGQKEVISAMIYNDLLRHDQALNFHALDRYDRPLFFP